MKRSQPIPSRILATSILAITAFSQLPVFAQTEVDPPVTEKIRANTDIHVVAPTNTFFGTRGLSQTASAEALGEGRLTFGTYGTWYQQQKNFTGVPNKNANIFTGLGSVSLGINRQIDVFASLSGFGSTDYDSDSAAGLSTVGGGIQGTLPLPQNNPIRLAAQLGIYQGFSNNTVNLNHADGYNYFETRNGLDFMAKLIQTLTLGHEKTSFKLHFNEGIVTSAQSGVDALLLLGAGVQVNIFTTILGMEFHSRTPFNKINMDTDPLWITPSLQFRTPYNINVTLGGDISLSGKRDDLAGTRALEPYRLFAGMAFTFDTEYGKRAAAKSQEQREAKEKEDLKQSNRELVKSMAQQAHEDSLARSQMQSQSDSNSLAMGMKAHNDSLAMADKARLDSLALVDATERLRIEKSKRSEAEKQLLSTGLLLLDAVYFESGKTEISINSKPYLNIIAKMLTKYPKLRIEVSGHTDNIGSESFNLGLSQGRAQSVAAYMTGVAPDLQNILSSRGYAFSQPKADNSTAAGRKLNRRTELQVLNKDVLAEYNN